MRPYLLCMGLLLVSMTTSFAQFDTIAGPNLLNTSMVEGEDNIFLARAEFGPIEIQRIDVTNPEFPASTIFTNPFSTTAGGLAIAGDELYVCAAGETIAEGRIYQVSDIYGEAPSTELYLTLPWLPVSMAINDSIMYIANFSYFGGDIYRYDMRTPEVAPTAFVITGAEPFTGLMIHENELYFTFLEQGRIVKVNLASSSGSFTTVRSGMDSPGGTVIDDNKLYVAVRNANSNASSRVKIYDLNQSASMPPLEEVASNTYFPIGDVARINGETYVLETTIENFDRGSLLRIQSVVSSVTEAPLVELAAFPNPTTGKLSLGTDNLQGVEVMDATGRKINVAYDGGQEIDMSQLPAGMYTVLAYLVDGGVGKVRVIKQ